LGAEWGSKIDPCQWVRDLGRHFFNGLLVQDKKITRGIYQRFDGKLALNCFVIEGGEITVGDEVQLVRGRACAEPAAFIE
jgi:hypothetical protein